MTLEGAEGRIWCSKIGWQTVSCSWSIDGEAALTGSSPGLCVNVDTQPKTRIASFSSHSFTHLFCKKQ